MKKFIAMTAAIVLSSAVLEVHAGEGQEVCSTYHGVSKTVMEGRQQGLPMPEMMEKAKDSQLLREMIIDAFDYPRFSTEKMQNKTIDEFANTVYKDCAKAFQEEGRF